MFFRDKDIAQWLGRNPSSVSRVRKNHKKKYALYRMGYASIIDNPDDQRWQKVKHTEISLYLGMSKNTFSIMKKSNPKKYEILKRGFLALNT